MIPFISWKDVWWKGFIPTTSHYIYIYTYPPVCMWWHVKDFTTFTKHMVKWDVIGEWWRSHGDWLVLLLAFWQKTPDDEFHSSQATDGQSIGWPGYDPLASSTIIDPAVNGFTHLMYFVKKKICRVIDRKQMDYDQIMIDMVVDLHPLIDRKHWLGHDGARNWARFFLWVTSWVIPHETSRKMINFSCFFCL